MIEITPTVSINENELDFTFIRAEGPGGQNINKVSTAVQLRFDIADSPSIPDDVKARLIKIAGRRITKNGILIIEARRYRTQEGNREDAIHRFIELIRRALIKPKRRKKTRPSQASQEKRLREKKHRGEIKRKRGRQSFEDKW
jgi:ribosome-associated protein